MDHSNALSQEAKICNENVMNLVSNYRTFMKEFMDGLLVALLLKIG
jgi:hypothetical protein